MLPRVPSAASLCAARGRGAPPTDEVERRIEELFRATAADRSQALALKAELDRRGLFKRFEDRFLDLFKCAE